MSGSETWNFCYPTDLSKLRTEKLKLVPFDSNISLFAYHYTLHTSQPSALANFRYLPYGPFFHNTEDFLGFYNTRIRPSNATLWFAVLVSVAGTEEARRQQRNAGIEVGELNESLKVVKEGEQDFFFAGSIGLLNAAAADAVCEIGHINILPWAQRTFITTNANALLLYYLLDPPSEGGLALRRVTWLANAKNERSVKAAQRLGFRLEGIMRWHRILPEGKDGKEARDGRGPARDMAMLSICWDDWRDGVKDKLKALQERA